MAVIRVPKTPGRAFNTSRKPSKLLEDQLKHLEWAARPASERSPADFLPVAPRTEAEAASKIARLTTTILENASARRAGVSPVALDVPDPAAGTTAPPRAATVRHPAAGTTTPRRAATVRHPAAKRRGPRRK